MNTPDGGRLSLVNHSSVLIESGGVALLTDPWYTGAAFGNGWELHSPTLLTPEDVSQVTHVWISHEHPDHFSPPTIKKWLVPHKDRLTVLYKKTPDQRVVTYLRKQGLTVQELPDGEVVDLNDKVRILSKNVGVEDSMLVMQTPDGVVVNTNDSILLEADLETLRTYGLTFGRPDYLLTQYGLAGKEGNAPDTLQRRKAAQEVRQMVISQAQTLDAGTTIPFASMKFFSHRDNFYMNDGDSKPAEVVQECRAAGVEVALLYPGDSIVMRDRTGADTEAALARYARDWEQTAPREYDEGTFDLSQLQTLGKEWAAANKVHSLPLLVLLRCSPLAYSLRPLPIHLTDTGLDVVLTWRGEVQSSTLQAEAVHMSSVSLASFLRDSFGGLTLFINARFEASPVLQKRMRVFAQLGTMRGSDQALDFSFVAANLRRLVEFGSKGKV